MLSLGIDTWALGRGLQTLYLPEAHTDFVAAVWAAHLHEWKGIDPAEGLQRAA